MGFRISRKMVEKLVPALKWNYLVYFEDSKLNILGGKGFPATEVSYDYFKTEYEELGLATSTNHKMLKHISKPSSVSISFFERDYPKNIG